MTDFKFECPHCQQRMQVEVKNAGRQLECPACHHLIRVPPAPGMAQEDYNPQSGATWNTYVPGQKPPAKS